MTANSVCGRPRILIEFYLKHLNNRPCFLCCSFWPGLSVLSCTHSFLLLATLVSCWFTLISNVDKPRSSKTQFGTRHFRLFRLALTFQRIKRSSFVYFHIFTPLISSYAASLRLEREKENRRHSRPKVAKLSPFLLSRYLCYTDISVKTHICKTDISL